MPIQWTEFARVSSRSDGGVYRIDVNPDGEFRCTCKGFIYSKSKPRQCRHTLAAEQDVHDEKLPPPSMPVSVKSEARALVAEMLRVGHIVVHATVAQRMAEVLEPRLANGPALTPIKATPTDTYGVRMIELD